MTPVARASLAIGGPEVRTAKVRRLLVGVLLALGAAAIGVAVWSLANGGIGWDSRRDTEAELVTRSIHSLSLAQAYDLVPDTSEFYGVFLYQFADVLHLLTTGASERLGPDTPATYQYQGAATLILSVLSVSALAVAIAVAFRSLLAAAFAWSLTLATPLWLGMSHVDFKDLPVAAGVTLVNAGLILGFALQSRRRAMIAGAFLAGCGGGIALATRPGALTLLLVLTVGTVVPVLVWSIGRRRTRLMLPVFVSALAALVVALAFTWATNPIARIGTVRWLQDAADVARDFPWTGEPIRTAGKDLQGDDLPWWYVPAWLGAQLPLLTLVAVVGGFVGLAAAFARQRGRIGAATAIPLLPIALQAVVLPVGIVASGAVLYDGIRHLLFIVPALIAIAAVALALLDRRASARLAIALPACAVVVVAASLAASIRWAPYAYAFVNPVAGRNADGRSWELDYWGVSAREGVTRLRKAGYSPVYVSPTPQVGLPWGAYNSNTVLGAKSGLYVFFRWTRAADFGCEVIFTIERDGHTLGEGARCPNAPPQ